MHVELEQRKALLASILAPGDLIRYSDHYIGNGKALFEAAAQRELEGIVAKRRGSRYRAEAQQRVAEDQDREAAGVRHWRLHRSAWRARKLRLRRAGTLRRPGPPDSCRPGRQRLHRAVPRGDVEAPARAGNQRNPFFGKVESTRPVHFVKPELVAEIKFTEWTHEGQSGGIKMRAPVFQGLRFDKKPEECKFEHASTISELL